MYIHIYLSTGLYLISVFLEHFAYSLNYDYFTLNSSVLLAQVFEI